MSRASHTKPSVTAGCGYRANVSNGKVIIYPTRNYENCNVTLGLGDATFTFNPSSPPDTLKRVIKTDSKGKYTPQITPTLERVVKLFDSVQNINETFTDASNNTTNITFKKLISYKEHNETNKEYEATGLYSAGKHSGRSANLGGYKRFTGTAPINIKIKAVQLFTIKNGYAYLDKDGYVNVCLKGNDKAIKFNMGDGISDKAIIEFTVKSDNRTFICKNSHFVAIEVYIPFFSYGNIFKRGKNIIEDVIKVAGGQILKVDKTGTVNKSILTDSTNDDGSQKIIPMGENGVVDIIPDGNGGVKEITISDEKSEIIRTIGNYSLTSDNKLLYNDLTIANNIYGIGLFLQLAPVPLTIGKAGVNTTITIKETIGFFNSAEVKEEWNNAYRQWYSAQTLPICNDFISTLCYTRGTINNSAVNTSLLAINKVGDIFKINGSSLIKQIVTDKDKIGFNTLYLENHKGIFITFKTINQTSSFTTAETKNNEDNYIFKY